MVKGRAVKAEPSSETRSALGPDWIKSTPVGGKLLISLHVKPGSKIRQIFVSHDQLGMAIDAPAREGEANAEVVKYLAEILGVKKSDLGLVAGGKSRDKVRMT